MLKVQYSFHWLTLYSFAPTHDLSHSCVLRRWPSRRNFLERREGDILSVTSFRVHAALCTLVRIWSQLAHACDYLLSSTHVSHAHTHRAPLYAVRWLGSCEIRSAHDMSHCSDCFQCLGSSPGWCLCAVFAPFAGPVFEMTSSRRFPKFFIPSIRRKGAGAFAKDRH